MEKLYFADYGMLDWLEPRKYYNENWTYVGYSYGTDGAEYTLVRNDEMEMRYTVI